jgi:uncharacterized membrane protein
MQTDSSVEIDAPARTVWDVFADVEHWSEWTESIDRIQPLDGPALGIAKRFKIKQPRFPELVWEVTELEPGVSWTWRQRSPGSTTLATHEVVPRGDRRTLVRQRIDQRGPIGIIAGALTLRTTRRYLELEAQGLKARSEERQRRNAAPA